MGNLLGHNTFVLLAVVHISHAVALNLETLYIDLLLLLSRGFLLCVGGESVGSAEPWSISKPALSLQQYM